MGWIHRRRAVERIVGNPEQFGRTVQPAPVASWLLAAGIDLGSSCGFAYTYFRPGHPYDPEAAPIVLGQWDLSAGPYDSGAIRFVRLDQMLSMLAPDVVFYEEPKVVPPQGPGFRNLTAVLARAATSMELLGGFKTTICAWAERRGVPCQAYPIGRIKKAATGSGAASKEQMIEATNRRLGVDLQVDGYQTSGHDNMADAAQVLLLGLSEYALGCATLANRSGQHEDSNGTRPAKGSTRGR